MAGITTDIETNAGLPRKAENDGLQAEQHSLTDQIAADKHLKGQDAADELSNGKLPLFMFKIKPPGSV